MVAIAGPGVIAPKVIRVTLGMTQAVTCCESWLVWIVNHGNQRLRMAHHDYDARICVSCASPLSCRSAFVFQGFAQVNPEEDSHTMSTMMSHTRHPSGEQIDDQKSILTRPENS